MYIRWKRRRLRRRNDIALVAVLVQSQRVHGVPRQRIVRYLGSIRSQERATTAAVQAFWQRVAAQLTALALDPATRQALEYHLARVVPAPALILPPPTTTTPMEAGHAAGVAETVQHTTGMTRPRPATPLPGGLSVRWRRRRLRRPPEEAWDAILVRRVWHQGTPRYRAVGYLASIRARYHTARAHRAWFWTRVEARLTALALDAATRQAVETHLAQAIPRPTPSELADIAVQRANLAHWTEETVS
jgi:hypothetical protein